MAEIVVVAGSLLGPVLELGKCIVAPIKRQFNYLCRFNSNIQSLRDEVKKLDDARVGLQMQVDTAERNAEVIVPQVETWLTSANNEIQVKMNEIEAEILKVKSGCLAIKSRFSLSRKVKKTIEAMKDLRDNCNFKQISQPTPPTAVVSIPLGKTYEFQSRKQIEEDIMEALRGKMVNIMGICGMGGVGKTTMAKRIIDRAREELLYDEVVMVVISQQLDMLKIQREIAKSLGLRLEDESLLVRANKLRAKLTRVKRILVILDDAWEMLKLEDLGISCDGGGCTILITSRRRHVLAEMDAKKVCTMQITI